MRRLHHTHLFSADGRGKRPSGTTMALVGFSAFLHIATLSVSILTPATFTTDALSADFELVSLVVGDVNLPTRASTDVLPDIAVGELSPGNME